MIKLLFGVAFLFTTSLAPSPWLQNLDKAEQVAKSEHKLILLNFSGSDWCIPCMKLRTDIFESDAFMDYAKKNLVLVNADFPRKKKDQLSKEQQQENDALAAKYNPDGRFPFTVLLDSNGNKLKVWDGYYSQGPDNFVDEITGVKN
ncbi:MAG TPA: thioredoxin family protein [Hanamia sp.]|nr:thioredoxin family protein [Hanamia sp.]